MTARPMTDAEWAAMRARLPTLSYAGLLGAEAVMAADVLAMTRTDDPAEALRIVRERMAGHPQAARVIRNVEWMLDPHRPLGAAR